MNGGGRDHGCGDGANDGGDGSLCLCGENRGGHDENGDGDHARVLPSGHGVSRGGDDCGGAHAHGARAHDVHARDAHAHDVHAHGVHARDGVHAHDVHARGVHARDVV